MLLLQLLLLYLLLLLRWRRRLVADFEPRFQYRSRAHPFWHCDQASLTTGESDAQLRARPCALWYHHVDHIGELALLLLLILCG